MVFSYLACVCPPSTCFTKSLCFICLGQHNQWVYYDGVIIVPTLILLFFVCSPRRKLPRTYWPSSTLDVTHIALSMCIVFMCPPSWVLEEMQRDKNTKRVSSEMVPLETSESRAKAASGPLDLIPPWHFHRVSPIPSDSSTCALARRRSLLFWTPAYPVTCRTRSGRPRRDSTWEARGTLTSADKSSNRFSTAPTTRRPPSAASTSLA